MAEYVNADPQKRFFIAMFTRDISLEDCVLDLIDNSIDALFRTKKMDRFDDIISLVAVKKPKSNIPEIRISYDENSFIIEDNCGGITKSLAIKHVFNFGHIEEHQHMGKLGVYGIGLKRAIFKIGNLFSVSSNTKNDNFSIQQSISEWLKHDKWRFEIKSNPTNKGNAEPGTRIEIRELYPAVVMRMRDGTFGSSLRNKISSTYLLFLEKKVRVKINNKTVEPYIFPIGNSALMQPSHFKEKYGKVYVHLFAGLAQRNQWRAEKAGWCIFCNGRMVAAFDKTNLSGWGTSTIPAWHSKYRGFIGLAFFSSKDSLALPWTTTKQGINLESEIFPKVRNEMISLTQPIVKFCNNMYPGEIKDEVEERNVANSIKTATLSDLIKKQTKFEAKVAKATIRTTTKISYEVRNNDFDAVKKILGHSEWKPSKIGEYTFNYFKKRECIE
jgi:hypothetical protein